MKSGLTQSCEEDGPSPVSQQQEAPFVTCVVTLYCTSSGVLFPCFFPSEKNHKICNRPNFCLLFVLMIDLKMKNVNRTESVVLNYICNLKFV